MATTVMSTAIATVAQPQFGREQVELIKRTIAKGATDDELKLFMAQCERTGLDPFDRQIYFIKRKQKDKLTGQWVEVGQTQTSIDGFRVVAERTGEMDGQDVAWCDETGAWTDIWLKNTPPFAARVLAYRKGCDKPFPGIARFDEYVQTFSDGKPMSMWAKMPANQLAKCAEALALRKAFPKQLSGLYTREEMGQADNDGPKGFVVEPAKYAEWADEHQDLGARPSRVAPGVPALATGSTPALATDNGPDLAVDLPAGARLVVKVEVTTVGASKGRIYFNAPLENGASDALTFKEQIATLASELCQTREPCFVELKKSAAGNWRVEGLMRVPANYEPPRGLPQPFRAAWLRPPTGQPQTTDDKVPF